MPKKCSMLECRSNYDAWLRDNDSVSVYKIPSDSVRREKWLKIIPRKNWNITVSSVVCIRHFKEKFLERYEIGRDGQQIIYKTPRLKRYAVPTLFGDPLEEVAHSESDDTDEDEKITKPLNKSRGTPAKDAPTAPGGAKDSAAHVSIVAPVVHVPEVPEEPENKIKIHNTCRVCMRSSRGLQSIYTKRKNYLVVALIANLSGVPIYRNDGLPDEICDSCFVKVYEANETRKMCEESDKKLKHLLSQLKAMDYKDVVETAEARAKNKEALAKGPEFVSVDNIDETNRSKGPATIPKGLAKTLQNENLFNSDFDISVSKAPKITITVGAKKNKDGELDATSVADTEQENFSAMFEQSADEEEVNEPVDSTNNNEEDPNEPYRFACCMCVNICETEEELLDHVKNHEIPPREYQPGKTVECRLCLKRFSKTKNYNNHIKCVYEEKKLCPLCGMSLYERHFPDHMAGHADPEAQEEFKQRKQQRQIKRGSRGPSSGQTKKACPDCGREFLLTTHLNIHIKAVHLKEKPYVCTTCNSAFAYKDSLTKHAMKHSNERKFTCHLCPKTYIYRADLRVHLQRHENVRNYPCTVCELKFFSNKHLKQHLVTHNPESIWKCDMCDKSYRQQYTLTKHRYTEHKVPIKRKGNNLFGKGYQRCEVVTDGVEEHLMDDSEVVNDEMMVEEKVEEIDDQEYIIQETHYDGEYESVPVVEIPMDG